MLHHSQKRNRYLPHSLALLALAAGSAQGWAQYDYLDQPQPSLTLPHLKYFDLDVEAEQTGSTGGGTQSTYQRIYVAPTVGIGWDYYLYHPDLMTFSLLAEPGYAWQSSGSPQNMSQENDLLLNGDFHANILQLKPYASTVFATATHDTRQYDFYNTLVEDVQTYGLTTGYREGAVPFSITFEKSTSDSSGFAYNSTSDNTSINLHAVNERGHGNNTDLTYQYQDWTWNQAQGTSSSSASHNATLTDAEHFGSKMTLNSTLLYNHSEYSGSGSDNVNLTENFVVEHTPHLRSFYDYGISSYSDDTGNSVQNTVRAGLQHELYESLNSYGDVHGSSLNSDYAGSTLDSYSGGATVSENYSKRLGDWGHLTLGNSASYDLTEQDSAGAVLPIVDEPHQLITGQPVRLNQPQVLNDGNLVIYAVAPGGGRGVLLIQGIDYIVTSQNPWMIMLGSFPVNITSGANVLVSYDVQPNPTGNYATFTEVAQARLELWNNLLDFYVHYDHTENNASSPGFILENLDQFQAGTDFSWKRLRLGASYIDNQSSLFSYSSYATTESYALLTAARYNLSLNFNQEWSYYPATGGTTNQSSDLTFYNYQLHFSWRPTAAVEWTTEAGLQQQRGENQDQDLLAARTYLNWSVGKLKVNLGYEYEDQEYVGTGRFRNFAFVRVRRNF
jgi:hypothetical protein